MGNKIRPYKPIDCSFYDRLESAITLKEAVLIEFVEEESRKQLDTVLVDLFIDNKIEFVLTVGHKKIRLDNILSLNGIFLEKAC